MIHTGTKGRFTGFVFENMRDFAAPKGASKTGRRVFFHVCFFGVSSLPHNLQTDFRHWSLVLFWVNCHGLFSCWMDGWMSYIPSKLKNTYLYIQIHIHIHVILTKIMTHDILKQTVNTCNHVYIYICIHTHCTSTFNLQPVHMK